MLPASDVKFLQNVTRRLQERRLHVYMPGPHRSACALILGFADSYQRCIARLLAGSARDPSLTALDITEHLGSSVDLEAPSALRLLFMKRAEMSADRWSGQIAFPGGRRDPDDRDDLDTVCREVNEDLGIPLGVSNDFILLGQLPDRRIRSRVSGTSGLIQSRFVYLHIGDVTPSIKLTQHEVDAAQWMPLTRLEPQYVVRGSVCHPLTSFIHTLDADVKLVMSELFPGTQVCFPSLSMPSPSYSHGPLAQDGEAQSTTTSSPSAGRGAERDGVTGTEGDQCDDNKSQSGEYASGGSSSKSTLAPPWRVWGLTLRSSSELLMLDDRPPVDWPLFSSNSVVVQSVLIDAFHGYYEAQLLWYRMRACARWRWLRTRYEASGITSTASPPHPTTYGVDVEGGEECLTKGCSSREARRRAEQKWVRVYEYGTSMQRRFAILPPSVDPLVYSAPSIPTRRHLFFFAADVAVVLMLMYTVALMIHTLADALRLGLGRVENLQAAEKQQKWRTYTTIDTVPSTDIRSRTRQIRRLANTTEVCEDGQDNKERKECEGSEEMPAGSPNYPPPTGSATTAAAAAEHDRGHPLSASDVDIWAAQKIQAEAIRSPAVTLDGAAMSDDCFTAGFDSISSFDAADMDGMDRQNALEAAIKRYSRS